MSIDTDIVRELPPQQAGRPVPQIESDRTTSFKIPDLSPVYEGDPRRGAVSIERVEPESWDRQISIFADVLHEQSEIFSAAQWGGKTREHVLFRQNGAVIGAAIVVLVGLPFTGTGLAVIKWGPLWRRIGETADPSRLALSLEALRREYGDKRGYHMTLLPRPEPAFHDITMQTLDVAGFHAGAAFDSPGRYFVNTGLSIDDLSRSLDQKWRYNLKKALKNQLQFHWCEPGEGHARFMALYDSMLSRKGFLDESPIATLEALLKSPHQELRPKICFVEKDGRPLAGAVLHITPERAVYLYGATSDDSLRLKAGYVMHWQIAEHLCQTPGVDWYDLGGVDLHSGLHQFKKGFVGKAGRIGELPPRRHYCSSMSSQILGSTVFKLRDYRGRAVRLIHDTIGMAKH